ncbi:MAG: hypothetical protein SWK76_13650 [Actinomycetota bacterium]|nr:hypothetical protein [Actinomycetota bacterium]
MLYPQEYTFYDKNGNQKVVMTTRGDKGVDGSDPADDTMWLRTEYEHDLNDREISCILRRSSDIDPDTATWTEWGDGYYEKQTVRLKNGQVEYEIDHTGRKTSYQYDDAGRVAAEWNDEGLVTTYEYFADGQVKSRVDPLSTGEIRFGYDAAGRQNEEIRTLESVLFEETVTYTTRKTYDTRDNVIADTTVRVDPDDPSSALQEATTTYAYDANNLLLKETKPAAQSGQVMVTDYAYDAVGNKISEQRTCGYEAYWTYDARSEVVEESIESAYAGAEDNYVTHYTYDLLGNVASETLCEGEGGSAPVVSHKEYLYDGMGERSEEKAAVGAEAFGFTLYTYSYIDDPGYDALAMVVTTATYENLCDGLKASETRENIFNNSVSGTYTFSSPDQHISYSYEAFGKTILERWDRDDGPDYEKTYTYDGNGNLIQESIGSGQELRTTAYEYDDANRIRKRILPDADGEGAEDRTYSYNYSDGDIRVSETDPEGKIVVRTYDDLGREVVVEGPGDYYAVREYDESGNIIEERVRQSSRTSEPDLYEITRQRYDNLGEMTEQTVVVDGQDLTTTFTHDIFTYTTTTTTPGGHTTTYSYDSLDRLRRQELPHEGEDKVITEYRYDALGRETLVLEGSGEQDATRYTYDGLSNLRIVEQWTGPWNEQEQSGTGTLSETQYRVDINGNLLMEVDAEGHTTYYSANSCGWTIETQNAVGETEQYSYNIYGEMEERVFTSSTSARTLYFEYDGRGRLQTEGARETNPPSELASITYSYNKVGDPERVNDYETPVLRV